MRRFGSLSKHIPHPGIIFQIRVNNLLSDKITVMQTFISSLSGKELPGSEKVSGRLIPGPLLKLIQSEKPDFGEKLT